MNDWIPLLKELLWPLFWTGVLLGAWKPLRRLLKAFEERIASGAEFEAGTKGIRVGPAPKLAEVPSALTVPPVVPNETPPTATTPTPRKLYLVHTSRRDRSLDQGDRQYFRIRLYLDADDPQLLDEVSHVTYHLHETVNEPIRTVRDRRTSFEVRSILWGEFNAVAVVRLNNGRDVTLERYLNL